MWRARLTGAWRTGALLTPQGRLLYDFFFWEQAGGAVLDVAASAREELIRKLQGYRLRAKLEIEPTRGSVFAAWGVGPPLGEPWRADPRLADLGWRLAPPEGLAPREELLVTEADYEVHRLALGVPDPAKDGKEADYPIELNMDLLGGIDFKKGCFVGQETTSRMHRRGGVKSRMAPLAFAGPAPPFGAEILAADRRAGEVRGGGEGRALALVRIDRAIHAQLRVQERPVELDVPPWLQHLFHSHDEEAP